MDQLALLFALLLGAVVTVPLGDRIGVPSPVLMTLLGGVLALLPFVPDVQVPPEYILPLVLPPLLYAAVYRTSWRQFAANKRPIFLLAVALVFVTTAVVAAVADALVPGLGIAGAVALGALVAPPDPVAATSVAGRLGLPRRLVSILEGEGLFNDVTAITLYHVAVAAAVTGSFSVQGAVGELVLSGVVAVAVGLALGWAANKLAGYLGDATLQTGLSLLVPFASYVLAEELKGSGVLAVLMTALYLSSGRAVDADDVQGRLVGQSFWSIVDMLVTGVAFGLIGLELAIVVGPVAGRWSELLPAALAVVAAVVVLRLVWLLPAAWLAKRLHRRKDLDEDIPLNWRETTSSGGPGCAGWPRSRWRWPCRCTFERRQGDVPRAGGDLLHSLRRGARHARPPGADPAVAGQAAARTCGQRRRAGAGAAARAAVREGGTEAAAGDGGGRGPPEEVAEALLRRALGRGRADIARHRGRGAAGRAQPAAWPRAPRRCTGSSGELLSAARHEILAARGEPGVDPEVVRPGPAPAGRPQLPRARRLRRRLLLPVGRRPGVGRLRSGQVALASGRWRGAP